MKITTHLLYCLSCVQYAEWLLRSSYGMCPVGGDISVSCYLQNDEIEKRLYNKIGLWGYGRGRRQINRFDRHITQIKFVDECKTKL